MRYNSLRITKYMPSVGKVIPMDGRFTTMRETSQKVPREPHDAALGMGDFA